MCSDSEDYSTHEAQRLWVCSDLISTLVKSRWVYLKPKANSFWETRSASDICTCSVLGSGYSSERSLYTWTLKTKSPGPVSGIQAVRSLRSATPALSAESQLGDSVRENEARLLFDFLRTESEVRSGFRTRDRCVQVYYKLQDVVIVQKIQQTRSSVTRQHRYF